MSEKFDPSDEKYKKVENLPEKYQGKFVNVPKNKGGGFVRKEAMENYKTNEKDAKEERESIFGDVKIELLWILRIKKPLMRSGDNY